jgi:hypothetical protein
MPQATTTNAPAGAPSGSNGAAPLTEEEILGLGTEGAHGEEAERSAALPKSAQGEARNLSPRSEERRNSSPASEPPPRKDGAQAAHAAPGPAPEDAQALAQLFPGGVDAARAAAQSAEQLAKLDAAYFSGDAQKQAQLAEYLYSAEPRAFAAMVEHAARVLAARDPAAYAAAAKAFGAEGGLAKGGEDVPGNPPVSRRPPGASLPSGEEPSASAPAPLAPQDGGTQTPRQDLAQERAQIHRERQALRLERFEAFQRAANDAVVAQVRAALDATLDRALPETVDRAARQRIAQDIFDEVHAALASDRALSQQVAGVIAQERYDDAAREQVAALVFARARAVLPEAARRVVGAWTSGVLGAHRRKIEKQDAAARRIELAGGGAPEIVPRRALAPEQVRRMSDEEILDY